MVEIMRRVLHEKRLPIDNVIVGGGNISGGVACIELGRAGKSVLCVDQINPLSEQNVPSCTGCGGLIQEQTAELLEKLGVPVEKATRRILDGYIVTLPTGEEMKISAPMRSVYRGHGPLYSENKMPGLDALVLETALKYPTVSYRQGKITDVDVSSGKQAKVYLKGMSKPLLADFFVGAFGHNPKLVEEHIKVPLGKKLDSPKTQKSTVMEMDIGNEMLEKYFGSYARVLVLPYDKTKKNSNVLFVALIPKDHGALTMVIMGDGDVETNDVNNFISSDYLSKNLPKDLVQKLMQTALKKDGGCKLCSCTRSTITAESPHHHLIAQMGGVMFAGDASRARIFKDGIGAAVKTASAAANAIITGDFDNYLKQIDKDFPWDDHIYANKFLQLNDAILANTYLRAMLLTGKSIPGISDFLIDPHMRHLLTGDIAYKNIFPHKLSEIIFNLFGI